MRPALQEGMNLLNIHINQHQSSMAASLLVFLTDGLANDGPPSAILENVRTLYNPKR